MRALESGPAAGVLNEIAYARPQLEPARTCSPSTWAAPRRRARLVRGGTPVKRYTMEVARVHEFRQGSGLPMRIPVIDMIEIGAGGGSIAEIDDAWPAARRPAQRRRRSGPRLLRPRRHQADADGRQPACSAISTRHSSSAARMALDRARGARRPSATAWPSPSALETLRAAWGIHEIVNEDVARAFRIHASERGFDYRRCSMICPAARRRCRGEIARKLRIPRVVFPSARAFHLPSASSPVRRASRSSRRRSCRSRW